MHQIQMPQTLPDDLMLDSNYGLLGGDDGATEDYDIYDESNDFD